MPEDDDEREAKIIQGIVARMQEHFGDFLIVARLKDGGMMWKSSDPTWGVGAAERYSGIIRDQALVERIQAEMEGDA